MTAVLVNPTLSRVLGKIETPLPVPEGSREFHQAQALQLAQCVAQCYSADVKRETKRKCLAHLLASLRAPQPSAGGSNVAS